MVSVEVMEVLSEKKNESKQTEHSVSFVIEDIAVFLSSLLFFEFDTFIILLT